MNHDDLDPAVQARLKRLPAPYQAHHGVVPLPPPEHGIELQPILKSYDDTNAALARVEVLAGELADPYLISRILPRREAVSSSSIEGTNSTLDELLAMEEGAGAEATEAAEQVRDYALALDALVPQARNQGPSIFTTELVRELHRAVMRGDKVYRDQPGALRDRAVWIGGSQDIAYSSYNPAPPEDVSATLEESMRYMRRDTAQGLILRMGIAHAHFEAVHPFGDGNGRVGRLLLPLMMAAEGRIPLYLSPYIEAHKGRYYGSLKAAQQRLEWHQIAGFIAEAIVGTVDELMATRDALARLGDLWRKRRKFRKGSAALRALDLLPHYPLIATKRLAGLLDVSMPAAAKGIDTLIEAGILKERTGQARNRVFAAPEALSIINRPFGEFPILPRDR